MRSLTFPRLFCLFSLFPFTGSWAANFELYTPKVKEVIPSPREWSIHGIPPPDHNIVLRIGLPQPNFHVLEQHLYEVSDPDHPRYGAHLSKEEVETLVAPHQESIVLVDEWLRSHGIEESGFVRSPARDWVKLTIPVSLAEKMLDTTYYVWKHASSGEFLVRTTSYSLPEILHPHIDVVQPTTTFGRFKRSKSTIVRLDDTKDIPIFNNAPTLINPVSGIAVDASCNTTITITCLQQLYNAVGYKPAAKGNSIGITGYLGEYANVNDLQLFYADQRRDAIPSSFEFISVKGGLNSQNGSEAGFEAGLDVQFAFGLSHPIPATFFSTAGSPPFKPDLITPTDTNEPYLDWLDFVLNSPSIPLTISTSYGDDEQTVPESFALRACAGFAQLGARGVSVLFSSGDGGVGDNNPNPATHKCFSNDGHNTTRFIPIFPASCPFVTAVGGTTNILPEVAVSRFFSGGGFSNYFNRPAYQDKVVNGYLNALPVGTYKGLFNRQGRGYPDISAQSDRFRIFVNSTAHRIGGTSASSPTIAGIVSLLNDVRLSRGLSPLGFLNPLIYSKAAKGFNDITIGHNSGCGTTGFNATKGWDPVTGFGTPDFRKLARIVGDGHRHGGVHRILGL